MGGHRGGYLWSGGLLLAGVLLIGGATADPAKPASPAPSPSTPQALAIDSWTISWGRSDPAVPQHYIAYVKSANGDLFGFGCDKAGQSSVYGIFLSHQYLAGGSNPTRDLEYSIDHRPARSAKWDYLEQYAYMHDPEGARDIAAEIAIGKTLDLRAFTYELYAVDAHFYITGAKAAIETLYRDCKG